MSDYRLSSQALLRQVLLALCSSLGLLAGGQVRGYSSPGIPSMELTSPDIVPDSNAISWITSIPPLGAFVGSLIAMPWMQFMGRKKVILVASPFFVASWMGIALSTSTNLVILFRGCCGIMGGVLVPCVQVYVCECSHPKIRGLLASLPSVSMVLGVLSQYFFGLLWDWRGMAWACSAFPALLFVLMLPFPESPPWLKLNGKKSHKEAYRWFGIRPDLEHAAAGDPAEVTLSLNENTSKNTESRETSFCSKGVLMPLMLALFIITFQQTCGNDVITYSTVKLLDSSGSNINSFLASLGVGIVHFIFVLFSIFLVDKYGRKCLLMFSAFGMGVSLLGLSCFFYLQRKGMEQNFVHLPLISITVFIAVYSLGFCTVPLIILGEIFPIAYRSMLGPLTMSVGLLAMFIELKTFDDLSNLIGKDGGFALYAFFNFFAVFYTFFMLPETKGKSLEEIEVYFSEGNMFSKRKPSATVLKL